MLSVAVGIDSADIQTVAGRRWGKPRLPVTTTPVWMRRMYCNNILTIIIIIVVCGQLKHIQVINHCNKIQIKSM